MVRRYGWFAVLTYRSFPVLRECTSLLAGSFEMAWPPFLAWNTAGGIVWVLTHALLGYYVGTVAGIEHGLVIILLLKLVALIAFGSVVLVHRRIRGEPSDSASTDYKDV